MASDTAGSIYAALFEDQLKEESARKASLESRGLAVISTSAALVSLLLALAALLTKGANFELPGAARAPLVLSCVLFVGAALLGLSANWPLNYRQLAVADLRGLLSEELWEGSSAVASRRVAEARAGVLETARKLNHVKGRLLIAAMLAEVAAVAALASSVVVILAQAQ